MPLDEEGAKWSCEPCIRGHRSSKCQHFDRLMMKVPKAGRPLAKCPHPKGTCSCQKTYAFMVRIPKGSTCLCRPLYTVPTSPSDSDQPPQASLPGVQSPAPGKIQKVGRRQSHIHAAPENIAKALESMSDNVKLEDGTSQYLAELPAHQTARNGNHTPSGNDLYAATPVHGYIENPQPAKTSSCCSSKPAPPPPPPPAAESGGGSCCSGKPTSRGAPSHLETQPSPAKDSATWNNMSYMNIPSSQSSWQNSMHSTQNPYMQSFGMQGSQLPQFYADNYTPNQPGAQYSNLMNGLGIAQNSMGTFPNSAQNGYASVPTSTPAGEPCYDCKCGDECQCLGCAAHPFNNTTRQHVQEMSVMMTFDDDEHTPEAIGNSFQTPSFPTTTAPTPMNFYMHQAPPPVDRGITHNSFDPYSNPSSGMPSGYSSPIQGGHHLNQQLMHPSEYYTIEYPVGLPSACSDVTGSCQCGNDCSCVGCLTHSGHNGVPLEEDIPEAHVTHVPEHHIPSHGPVPSSSAESHNHRIPTLENISVPCLSPRTFETSMI
ncbi:hypothetical protein N7478_000944 [Penicillium angulare]|uniref:uncharacterized protein n=1 Tax=Penicillium angulare TaxID=116970 RepID=UPI002540D285|nr:uncharacterized protein N7478_000944 [Penicillium angulare]KAJ5291693.1 hypothetical protein N7478_000944 [Penicillium angulare]